MEHTSATDQELLDEALRLSEARTQPYLTPGRRAQLSMEMNRVLFEYRMRHDEVPYLGPPIHDNDLPPVA